MGIRPLRKHLFFLLLPLICCLMACNRELVPVIPNPGAIDIRSYRAYGDGFSAGFSNAGLDPLASQGLYAEAQQVAWPALLSLQFGLEPDGFPQNLALETGSGYILLSELRKEDGCPESLPIPILSTVAATPGWNRTGDMEFAYHNLALPHLRMGWVGSDSFGRNSPFFLRMPAPSQPNYLSMVEDQAPDCRFFSIWLGTEDVLDAAMTGKAIFSHQPTSDAEFAEYFTKLLEKAADPLGRNRLGMVGNIPDVTRFPYFTSQGHVFQNWEGCNPVQKRIYIETEDPGRPVRIAEEDDLILMEVRDQLGELDSAGVAFGLSESAPLEDRYVLTGEEVIEIREQIRRYNVIIDSVVQAHTLRAGSRKVAVVDMFSLFDKLCSGQTEDGLDISGSYLSGGVFSLDGLYLTARGNALVANAFIEKINTFPAFGALIPTINVTTHKGVVYP